MFPLRPRRPRRPLHSLPVRSLTTYPRPIPPWVSWDPTVHKPQRQQNSGADWELIRQEATAAAVDEATRKAERDGLRDTQGVSVALSHDLIGRQSALKRLNQCLLAADAKRCNLGLPAPLWRAYVKAKECVPNLPSLLPDRAWDTLWSTQSVQSPTNRYRRRHLEQLYRDMDSVGKHTTVGQRVEYLKSLFFSGKEDRALMEWEEDHNKPQTGSRQDYKSEHLEVGARMHALAGNADRAREIMEELYRLYPAFDPSVMMAVFRSHTSTDIQRHHDTARSIYIKMKGLMGNRTTLEDYDGWFVGFLEAKHFRYAKQVFKDMIKDGHLSSASSRTDVEELLRRLQLLYKLGTDIEKMTSIAIDAIQVLPRPYHSFLFGDWMKNATVKKAPQAAAQILEMMFKRGNTPETFHFNLFLRALFRMKEKEHELKAENLGWQMIEKVRKLSPEIVDCPLQSEVIVRRARCMSKIDLDVETTKHLPAANQTTFALMMRHHASQMQWEHVEYLSRILKVADIQPNAATMNVLMDSKCRQGKYREAWNIYNSLTNGPEGSSGVFPDGASFRCLWVTLRLALDDPKSRNDPDLPTPRQLLAETLSWWSRCQNRHDAERFRLGLAAADHGAVTSLMMHCFSYTQDLPGSLVALHVLRKKFGIFPTNKLSEILQRQIAWVDLRRDSKMPSALASKLNKRNIEKLGHIYHILMQKRFQRMKITGDQFAYMSREEVGDLDLNLLSEFIRVILKRQGPPEMVENMINEAKAEVGIPNLTTGDIDAFSVS